MQCKIRWLGLQDYRSCWQAMRQFTDSRDAITPDEVWLVEHHPVFTQGQNGKTEHLLDPAPIPVVQTDRGGQITYHGPGQLMIYTLIDLKRKKLNVRELVTQLEQTVIQFLAALDIQAYAKPKAPGIYIGDKKICSIGLRVRHGCAYHGLAFNVKMDLQPFTKINPCGFPGLKMTQLSELSAQNNILETGRQLIKYLSTNLGYTGATFLADHSE